MIFTEIHSFEGMKFMPTVFFFYQSNLAKLKNFHILVISEKFNFFIPLRLEFEVLLITKPKKLSFAQAELSYDI